MTRIQFLSSHSFPSCAKWIGIFFSFFLPFLSLAKIHGTVEEFRYEFSGSFTPESFYGRNISLLNDASCGTDQIFYPRHVLDLSFGALYGVVSYTAPVMEFYFTARDRANWGNAASIASTSDATIKLGEAVALNHKHAFPRHIFWLRELWLKCNFPEICALHPITTHTITLGAFRFELGRGIALGSAYALGPEYLGFFSDGSVDQYAFGACLSGEIVKKKLLYDFYVAILDNKSGTLADVGEKILGQKYGRIDSPARGFGKINCIFAGRLNWYLFRDTCCGTLRLEPYALFNHEPEQRIEFRGDASSRLGTIGCAGDLEGERFYLGFDTAFNLGEQRVHGWDRNQIKIEVRPSDGAIVLVNSHVLNSDAKGAERVPLRSNSCPVTVDGATTQKKNDSQDLIAHAFQDETANGKQIGVSVCGDTLFNAAGDTALNTKSRFTNPYVNKYRGWMIVIDGCYKATCDDLKFCLAGGIASGDDNPNEDTKDGVYGGFIGLQEYYSGKMVRSTYLLGGRRLKRPLTQSEQSSELTPQLISNFTNLIYVGSSMHWSPRKLSKKLFVNPNILAFWQEFPERKFDVRTGKNLDEFASRFLGIETNLSTNYQLLENLKISFVGSIFFPGQFYTDIAGKPLNAEERAALDRLDRTGYSLDPIPNIGDDLAYTISVGIEYKF